MNVGEKSVDWKLVVLKKAVIGRIPFGDGLRRVKRRAVGYRPDAANRARTHLA